jgi:hypothetical protein
MELTQLAKEMLLLERQAGVVGRLLKGADQELLEAVAGAFGPLKPRSYQQRRWDAFWIAWLQECSERVPCANQTGGVDTAENGGDWTTDWTPSFCDGVMHPVVAGVQNPDAAVGGTQVGQPNWHAQGHQ